MLIEWVILLGVCSGRESSLVGALFDQGYDVWLGDTRGRAPFLHETEHHSSSGYWDYSIDDLVEFDIPRMVAYVHEVTGQELGAVVAHSQGGLLTLLALANNPDMAGKVGSFVGLQPPIAFGLRSHVLPANRVMEVLRSGFEMLAHPPYVFGVARTVMTGLCAFLPRACAHVICLAAGCASSEDLEEETLLKIFSYYPKETSWKNIHHLVQCEHSRKLQKYDYGAEENVQRYGQSTPPDYSFEDLVS